MIQNSPIDEQKVRDAIEDLQNLIMKRQLNPFEIAIMLGGQWGYMILSAQQTGFRLIQEMVSTHENSVVAGMQANQSQQFGTIH